MIIYKQNKNKYSNEKIIIDGHKFDSKKEGNRYLELKLLQKAGVIKELELQKEFILLDGFKKNGVTYKKISYYADFYYYDNERQKYIVEDTKGFKTDVYRIKKKLFENKYKNLEIKEL